MSSNRMFSTRNLILPAIIVICGLTLAQDSVNNFDYSEAEDGEHGEDPVPEVEMETTAKPRSSYPAERSNVYPYVKEKAPPFHFAVWDETGKICILAKLDASFTITYNTKYGQQQMIDRVDADATVDGRCESFLDEKPVMDVKWRGGFTFRMIFDKNEYINVWKIETLELLYNTADSLFRDSEKGGPTLAKSKDLSLAAFETRLDKSYFCPTTPTLNLVDSKDGSAAVLVRLFNMQVQAFKVKQAKFSAIQHCGQVGFGSGVSSPFMKDDNGMIVITFSIYIFCSVSTVLLYAGYRAWFTKKYDYGTMA